MQDYDVDNLVDLDQIVTTVKYSVLGQVVQTTTYTWTLHIPIPALVNAQHNPGDGQPAFRDNILNYFVDLPVGTTSTAQTLSKTPGELHAKMTHKSIAKGDTELCDGCEFDQVRWGQHGQHASRNGSCFP